MGALARISSMFRSDASLEAKSLQTMRHDGRSSLLGGLISFAQQLLPSTKHDYAKDVGDGLRSSVLAAPLNWIMRTFPEAPPVIERFKDAEWSPDPKHGLQQLLRRPNPFYSGRSMFMATSLDISFGNAYWVKLRNQANEVVQLWWIPRGLMQPKWDTEGKTFITHYEYRPGSEAIKLDPKDVVHFRFGLDPNNPRLGLSPLGALVREIGIDDLAANFTAAILRNLGVIGVVVSPKEKTAGSAATEDVKEVKSYLKANFSGDKRGEPLALGTPTDVQLLQYNMQGFDVGPIRDVSEERVCAALGIPAAVVGFGTGLQQTKVGATMKEMRLLAWTGGIIPLQDTIADEIDRSLLPDFDGESADVRMRFDSSKVRALWEDENEKHDRLRKDWLAGGIMRSEYRAGIGAKVDATRDNIFVQPVNLVQLGPTGEPIPITQSSNPAPAAPATDSTEDAA